VTGVAPHLRTAYEQAILKYKADYEEVLWAVADHPLLLRRSTDIYASYLRIMGSRSKEPLPRDTFNQRMNALKRATHGKILKANRQGWYEFSEPMMRGYVRLRAEYEEVPLEVDHPHLGSRFNAAL
jgi:hypothetical protein